MATGPTVQDEYLVEERWDTMTRTEVLTARGYDAETISGNGTHVERLR